MGAVQGQRAQRIEMLLLHEFYRRKFLLPDKLKSKDREKLTKAAARVQQMAEEGYIPEEDEEKQGIFSFFQACLSHTSFWKSPQLL